MIPRSKSTPQVHQIKAIFEGYRHEKPANPARGKSSNPQASADNSMVVFEAAEQILLTPEPRIGIPETIETVIEAPASRPKLSQKPSWIGPLPSRSATPTHGMYRRVLIQYHAPGLRAPVFITTSLSEPQWTVIEMDVHKRPDGSETFRKEFAVRDGEYQYKFRLGPGDWWVCDEGEATIDDGDGNRNNVIVVGPENAVYSSGYVGEHSLRSADDCSVVSKLRQTPNQKLDTALDSSVRYVSTVDEDETQGKPHNDTQPAHPGTAAHNEQAASSADAYQPADRQLQPPTHSRSHSVEHETSTRDRARDSLTSSPASSSSSQSSFADVLSPEADPSDISLDKLPTSHMGIMNEIDRAKRTLPKGVTSNTQEGATLPRRSSSMAHASSPTLPEVVEESEDMLLLVPEDSVHSTKLSGSHFTKDQVRQGSSQHSHGPTHDHHHSICAEHDMQEERVINDKELLNKRNAFTDLGKIFVGIAFAVVVAIIAIIVYSSGMVSGQDVVEDGRAVLEH